MTPEQVRIELTRLGSDALSPGPCWTVIGLEAAMINPRSIWSAKGLLPMRQEIIHEADRVECGIGARRQNVHQGWAELEKVQTG